MTNFKGFFKDIKFLRKNENLIKGHQYTYNPHYIKLFFFTYHKI